MVIQKPMILKHSVVLNRSVKELTILAASGGGGSHCIMGGMWSSTVVVLTGSLSFSRCAFFSFLFIAHWVSGTTHSGLMPTAKHFFNRHS